MSKCPHTDIVKDNPNIPLVSELPDTCLAYHTSGQKKYDVWQWTATGQPFNYTAWSINYHQWHINNFSLLGNTMCGIKEMIQNPASSMQSERNPFKRFTRVSFQEKKNRKTNGGNNVY